MGLAKVPLRIHHLVQKEVYQGKGRGFGKGVEAEKGGRQRRTERDTKREEEARDTWGRKGDNRWREEGEKGVESQLNLSR